MFGKRGAGQCEQDIDYYPYGGVEHDYCPNVAQNYKFTGKERDSESGLDNFEAKFDAANLGRFMSPDPMGGHSADPQSLNRYTYVRNNPLKLTDPSGMNFTLPCKGESAKCHNGHQGSYQWNSDQGTFTFTNISIGNQNGREPGTDGTFTGFFQAEATGNR